MFFKEKTCRRGSTAGGNLPVIRAQQSTKFDESVHPRRNPEEQHDTKIEHKIPEERKRGHGSGEQMNVPRDGTLILEIFLLSTVVPSFDIM